MYLYEIIEYISEGTNVLLIQTYYCHLIFQFPSTEILQKTLEHISRLKYTVFLKTTRKSKLIEATDNDFGLFF